MSPGILGILVMAFVLVLLFGLMYGFAEIIRFLEPVLLLLIALSIAGFVLGVLPGSLVKTLRARMSVYAMLLSTVCGGCVWLLSFMFVLLYLKWWVFLFIWLFSLSAPLAILLLAINEQYQSASFLLLAFGASYAMRYYAVWLADRDDTGPRGPGPAEIAKDVFDVEAEEK